MRRKADLMTMLAVLLLTLFMVSQASANMMTYDVTFSATNFSSSYGSSVPTDTVTGSFTITFDPTLSYPETTSGITLDSLNINLGSTFAFWSFRPGELTVGGINGEVRGVQSNTDDFCLVISNFATTPKFAYLNYTKVGQIDFYQSLTGTVTVAPIPIPSALLLLGSGLLGLAGLRRFRKG